MGLTVKHDFVSAKQDSSDATLIQPSHWNENHVVTDSSGLLVSSDYNFTALTPGGNLTSGITNSITLAPVPLGINGTNTNHYLYISNGAGTAEAVLITGGTAVSGAASGTITFVPANNHSGAWTIQSATAGIQESIYILPLNGGTIRVPAGAYIIYQTISVGNGTASLDSTRQGVKIVGAGPGGSPSLGGNVIGTKITWAGPTSGVMVKFIGPIYNSGIEQVYLNCNGIAATGISTIHLTGCASRVAGITIVGASSFAVIEDARPSGFAIGASCTWEDITIDSASLNVNSSGFKIGVTTFVTLQVSRSIYRRLEIICGTSGTGIELNGIDAVTFHDVFIFSGAKSIYFTPPIGQLSYPTNINFYRVSLGITPTWNASWIGSNIAFFDYLQEEDGFGVPKPDFPVRSGIFGFTSYGAWYGNFGINTRPTLATLEVFRSGVDAKATVRNAVAGNTIFELSNDGIGSYLVTNDRITNIVTITSDGVDTIWSIPLTPAAAPMVAHRPLKLTLATVPIYANNAAAITGGLVAGQIYRNGADPDHLCIVH